MHFDGNGPLDSQTTAQKYGCDSVEEYEAGNDCEAGAVE